MFDLLSQFRELVLSKTAKDTSVIFLGNLASGILGIIFTIIAARFLGPESWGVVAGSTGLIVILASVADLGLGSSVFRFLSKEWAKDKNANPEVYRVIVILRLASAVFAGILLILISSWIAPFVLQTNDSRLIILTAVGVLGVLLTDLQIVTFQAKQSWAKAALFIALTNTLRLILILALIVIDSVNLLNVLAVFVVSLLVSWGISLVWQKLPFSLPPNWLALSKKVFSFSVWLAGNQAVSSINSRIDVLLLLNIAGSFSAGIYGAASRIALGFPMIVGSFATVLAPRFASFGSKAELAAFFKKSIGLSVLISTLLIIGVLLAPFLVVLLGPAYVGSTQVLQWLFISFIPFTLSTPAVNILIYRFNQPYIITTLSLVSLPIIIFGNIFLIPIIGVLAPAFILLFINTLTMIIAYIFALRAFQRLV